MGKKERFLLECTENTFNFKTCMLVNLTQLHNYKNYQPFPFEEEQNNQNPNY